MNTTTMTPSSTKNNTVDQADGLLDTIGTKLHDAGGKLVDLKDNAQKTLGNSIDAIGSVLKTHPFAAVGIAAGVGLGAGYLLANVIRARI